MLESGLYANQPDKAQQMLQLALKNSDRLVRLVNDILDLERLKSGKVELLMEACDAADLIQQAVEAVQTIADESNIHLSWESTHMQIWADPSAIVQALTNLLGNAIKFSPDGSTAWLRVEQVNGEKSLPSNPDSQLSTPFVLFSVRDQGRGIPADKLESIFNQFQQVDVSDSRQKGGTGLGLAICEKIVKQHRGHIWVKSILDAGSTFYFTIPLPST